MPKSIWGVDFDDIMGTKPKKPIRQPISRDIKNAVLVKQNYKCAHCKKTLPARKHFHHKKPVSEGGKNTMSNIVALCPNCHSEHHHKESVKKANKKARQSKSNNSTGFNEIMNWKPPKIKF